jgi:ubiquinone/menaquinone biosynthesis C-methylase UbiE
VTFTIQDWHLRFRQQASWTEQLRNYLVEKIGLSSEDRILETGCGTGAITQDIHSRTELSTYGIDLDFERLKFAQNNDKSSSYFCGDGLSLPIADDVFSLVFCHFYLLWVSNPRQAVKEMIRVTKPGGSVAIFAEPDYQGRIDSPANFIPIGKLQSQSLEEQGADIQAGRKLTEWLSQPEIEIIESGLLQWQRRKESLEAAQMEWEVAQEDLRPYLNANELDNYVEQERSAWEQGIRIRYVPTFYALARVKK